MRNVLPACNYAPIDLVAVCDLDRERARQCGQMFGAQSIYTDYQQMLASERPDAVVVVTNYDNLGHPRYPVIVDDILRSDAHAWIEKPPAASSIEIMNMIKTSDETGKFVGVGFKKMFAPANVKAKEISTSAEFGMVSTVTANYPQSLPSYDKRGDDRMMRDFLDHIVHPYSVIRLLGGDIESLAVEREEQTGASITSIRFSSGAVGSLHLSAGQSGMAPKERTEIVGRGASVIVENNTRVTYFRPGNPPGEYGRGATFYGDNDSAPLTWGPEFSLGQLYNKGLFLLGYAPEIRYFCDCVLNNRAPVVGSLQDALEILKIYEAYRQPDGARVLI
jgi:predicted dehydrogenase